MAAANPDLPLAGMLVSIKDLYDEAGIATTAASKLLLDRAPANQDCDVVAQVKKTPPAKEAGDKASAVA